MVHTGNPFVIGRWTYQASTGEEWFFNGIIDEVSLWNTARTQEQIQENMNRQLRGGEQGLVGYWSFDEGTGTTVFDNTANNNNGLLGGGSVANEPIWVVSTAPVQPAGPAIVVTDNSPVVAGDNLDVTAMLPGTFQPDVRQLFYRQSGQTAYQSISLAQNDTVATVSIPAAAITPRGVEYYVRFVAGGSVETVPTVNPEDNPIRVQVQVDDYLADIDLPSLTYRMVSVPVELDSARIEAVLVDDFGAYDSTRWRLLRWQADSVDPDTGRYAEFTKDLDSTFTPGIAFWLNTRFGQRFDVDDGLSVDASAPYPVTLAPGWNQIGTPFAFPIAWQSIPDRGNVEGPWFYDVALGDYRPEWEETLLPWEGYFVYNPGASSVTLTFPPVEATQPPGKVVSRTASMAEAGYVLQLSASVPDYDLRDTHNYLGLHEHASDGRDDLDRAEPPGIGTHLRLSLLEDHERLARSFKPISDNGQQWDLELTVEVEHETLPQRKQVQVALIEHGRRPEGFDLYMLDEDLERAVSVEEGVFHVEVNRAMPVRHLRVIVGTASYAEEHSEAIPLEVFADALYQNYPNPFNPETVIGYVLGERKAVELAVYDVLGRRVRVLVRGEQGAGRYEVVWDGRDAGGRPVASGAYVVRLEAGGFTAIRKMLLLR